MLVTWPLHLFFMSISLPIQRNYIVLITMFPGLYIGVVTWSLNMPYMGITCKLYGHCIRLIWAVLLWCYLHLQLNFSLHLHLYIKFYLEFYYQTLNKYVKQIIEMALIPLFLYFLSIWDPFRTHMRLSSHQTSHCLWIPSHSSVVLTFLYVHLKPLSIRIGIWTHSGFRNFLSQS